jgi:hypothetical protein
MTWFHSFCGIGSGGFGELSDIGFPWHGRIYRGKTDGTQVRLVCEGATGDIVKNMNAFSSNITYEAQQRAGSAKKNQDRLAPKTDACDLEVGARWGGWLALNNPFFVKNGISYSGGRTIFSDDNGATWVLTISRQSYTSTTITWQWNVNKLVGWFDMDANWAARTYASGTQTINRSPGASTYYPEPMLTMDGWNDRGDIGVARLYLTVNDQQNSNAEQSLVESYICKITGAGNTGAGVLGEGLSVVFETGYGTNTALISSDCYRDETFAGGTGSGFKTWDTVDHKEHDGYMDLKLIGNDIVWVVRKVTYHTVEHKEGTWDCGGQYWIDTPVESRTSTKEFIYKAQMPGGDLVLFTETYDFGGIVYDPPGGWCQANFSTHTDQPQYENFAQMLNYAESLNGSHQHYTGTLQDNQNGYVQSIYVAARDKVVNEWLYLNGGNVLIDSGLHAFRSQSNDQYTATPQFICDPGGEEFVDLSFVGGSFSVQGESQQFNLISHI